MKKLLIIALLIMGLHADAFDDKLEEIGKQVQKIVESIKMLKQEKDNVVTLPVVTDPAVPISKTIPSQFIVGVNFNGGSVTIDGNVWRSYKEALNSGLATTVKPSAYVSKLQPIPKVDRDTYNMLNSVVWASHKPWGFKHSLAKGTYDIKLYVFENYQSDVRKFDVNIEGKTVGKNIGLLKKGQWKEYVYKNIRVVDGMLDVDFPTLNVDSHITGFSIHTSAIEDFEYSFKNCSENAYGHLTDGVAGRIDAKTLKLEHSVDGKHFEGSNGSIVRLHGKDATSNEFKIPVYKGKPMKHKVVLEFTQIK